MTKEEYFSEVAENLQKNIWDIEINQAFNRRRIEELEHDIGKPEILITGMDAKQLRKERGAMQQQLAARKRNDEAFSQKIENLQVQLDFVNTLI